jgi:hypothetical protein
MDSKETAMKHIGLFFGVWTLVLATSCVTAPGRVSVPEGKHYAWGGGGGIMRADWDGSPKILPVVMSDFRVATGNGLELGIQGLGLGYIEPYVTYHWKGVLGTKLDLSPGFSLPLTYLATDKIGRTTDISFALGATEHYNASNAVYLNLNWTPTTQRSGSTIFPPGGFPLAVTLGGTHSTSTWAEFYEWTDIGFLKTDIVQAGGYRFW